MYVDGVARGTQLVLALPPGPHRVRIEHAGFIALERDVELSEGSELRVQARLIPTAETRDAYESGLRTRSRFGWGFVLAGSALAVGGGVWTALESSTVSDQKATTADLQAKVAVGSGDPCSESNGSETGIVLGCKQQLASAEAKLSNARLRQVVGVVTTSVGIAALVTGVVLLLTVPRSDRFVGTARRLQPVFGWNAAGVSFGAGGRCSLNSDCTTPLVCGFERCRAQCATSRDCNGTLCVRSDLGANVCQLEDEVECTHNSQCAGAQLCGSDGRCRDVCITDKDCVTDLQCVTRVCAKPEELVEGRLPERRTTDAGSACTYASDCAGDLMCIGGRCDRECFGDKDCLVGWQCRTTTTPGGDGRCYPGQPRRDGDAGAGDGTTPDAATTPVVLDLTTNGSHVCALFDSGRVKCWGGNAEGALGLGIFQNRGGLPSHMGDALPYVELGTNVSARALGTGRFFSCAALTDGRLKCWGWNNEGQLGQGDTQQRGDEPGEMGNALPPINLGAGRTVKTVVGGGYHLCAILDNDRVKCWGEGLALGLGEEGAPRGAAPGQMGDALPYVDLGAGRTAKAIALGYQTTCAILDDDRVKCWGDNSVGKLGLGDELPRGFAAGEMGDALPYVNLGTGRTAKGIAVGLEHVCALLDNGRVKCWGGGGWLGLGDANARGDGPNEMGDALPYVELGPDAALQVVTNEQTTCARLVGGKVKCWGDNRYGQLGLGDTSTRGDGPNEMGALLPVIDLGSGRTAASIVVGFGHACASLDNRQVKCWGLNGYGELGLGDNQDRGSAPNQMGDHLTSG